MGSSSLKREILGIALLLFSVFLAGAFGALALAQLSAGVSVEASVGALGSFLAQPLTRCDSSGASSRKRIGRG